MTRLIRGATRALLPALMPVLLAACGGGDASAPTPPAAPTFNVNETVSTSTATVGDRVTWTVVATNSGSAATNATATLLVNVPSALTGLSVAATGASCGPAVSTLTCTIPAGLAAAGTATVIFSGTTNAPGTLASDVQPSGAGAQSCSSAADCSTSTTVNAAAVVTVAAGVDHAAVSTGGSVNWTITATNTGGPSTSAITLTDTLPANGIGSVTVTPTGASCNPISGNTLTCTIPPGLAATNGTATITIGTTATAVGSLVNTVAPGSGASCASSATCTTTTTVAAVLVPNVTVTAGVNKTTGFIGDTINWTLTATNSGTGASAAPITLTDTLPSSGIGSVTVTPTGATCNPVSGQTLTCTIPTGLAASGGTASVLVSTTASASGSLVNTVAPGTGASCTSSANCTTTTTIASAPTQIANSCGVMISAATLNSTFGGTSGSMVALTSLGTTSVAGPNTSSYLVGLASTGDSAVLESWLTPGTPAGGSAAANSTVAATGTQFICASQNGTSTTGASSQTKYTADLPITSGTATSAGGNIQVSKQVGSNGGFVMFNLPSLSNFSFEFVRGGSNGYALDYSTNGTTWQNIVTTSSSRATCTTPAAGVCDETNLVPSAINVPVLLRITNINTGGTMVIQKIMIKP